jgi:hypothetical protein
MGIIPTVMYTLHNYDVLSRASDPESNKLWQKMRLILVITSSVGLIIVSISFGIKWTGVLSDLCITFVFIIYFVAACLLGSTIFKANGLKR